MTEYVDLDDIVTLIEIHHGSTDVVRDWGLLESAVHRPRSSVFGQDAYPDLHTKAASLLESITRNQPLLDGNKRLGVRATALFYAYNDHELYIPHPVEGNRFIRSVAAGECPLTKATEILRGWVRPR